MVLSGLLRRVFFTVIDSAEACAIVLGKPTIEYRRIVSRFCVHRVNAGTDKSAVNCGTGKTDLSRHVRTRE